MFSLFDMSIYDDPAAILGEAKIGAIRKVREKLPTDVQKVPDRHQFYVFKMRKI